MKRILYSIQKHAGRLLMIVACGTALTSCDNILDNGYGDCTVINEYRVKFKYDHNMKYADAFANEVRSVTLYTFDRDGKFAYQRTEQGDILGEDGYTMPLEVEPGDYKFVTWAGLEGEESFSVPVLQAGVSTVDDLTCRMNRMSLARSAGGVDSVGYLKPLWHGEASASLSRAMTSTEVVTIPLKKNTNTLRIILQQLSDGMVDVSNYEFTVTDDNGLMNYNNDLLEDDTLTYYPYYKAQGSTEVQNARSARAEETLNVAVAELTVGRLVESQHPRLTVVNRTAQRDTVLSIPLIDYLKLCKMVAHYDMDTQEYLDREDEYNMTFFLDKNNQWVKTQIIINNWIVRYNDITPEF